MPTPLQNINAEKIQGNLAITSVSATTYYNLPTIGGFTGGTVAGATIFTNGLTANTISATTYYNLPISTDIRVTGGTYSSGTATFTNNTGGTFTVTGFSTGTSSTDIYTTGATYSNNNFLFTNNTGGTFNVLFNTVTGLTVNGDLNVTGNTNLKSLSATSAILSGSGSNILTIIGSGDTSNPIFTIQNLSGNTIFSVADYTSGPLFWVDTANGSPILEVNEFSPQLVIYGSISGSSLYGANIYVTGGTQSLFSGNSSVELVKIIQNGSGDAFVVQDIANGDSSHFVINASGNTAIGLTQPIGNDKLTVSGNTTIYGTLSATTYVGLPLDIRITGGTYTAGTATFTNNTGGTFSVSGFSSGGGSSSGVCGIANSGGTYTYYSTLSAAITAAVNGQTVDLLTDITETGSVTLSMKAGVKINGNGYTYTLSVNDDSNAMVNGTSLLIELYNLKVVRTGRSANAGGRVFGKNDTGSLLHLKCQNVVFENTYGVGVGANVAIIYGLTVNAYGEGVTAPYDSTGLNNCIITSSNSYGVNLPNSGSDIVNCNVTGYLWGIHAGFGTVYNSIGKTTSGTGIQATRVVDSTGISSSGTGIGTNNGYNCVGISTSSVGLSGVFTNSTGISTSGYGGSGTFNTCTLISSSNYALQSGGAVYLYNSHAQSTSSPVTARANIYNSTVRCLWDNAGGSCTNSFALGSHEVVNSFLEVTNASAYCITGYVGSTWKYTNNSFKGSTTPINTTNIIQGITNTQDNQGNILI